MYLGNSFKNEETKRQRRYDEEYFMTHQNKVSLAFPIISIKTTARTPRKWQKLHKLTPKLIFGRHKKYTYQVRKP